MAAGDDSGRHRVLIAGGGVAALEAMLALHDQAAERVAVTLVAPDEAFVYRPLSTGEPFELTEVTSYPLARLAGEHGAELVEGTVTAVDPDAHRVTTGEGGELAYDSLIVALGASRDSAFEHVLTFVDQRNVPGYRELLERVAAGRVRSIGFLVPMGVVWPFPLYELALMTADYATEHGRELELTIVTPAVGPLALFGPRAEGAMRELLAERGIRVHGGNEVRVLGPGRAYLEPDGEVFSADALVAIPRLTGPRIPGLPHGRDRFIPTDEHGRVEGLVDVYAAGDCATYPFKQGGLAAQQADAVVAVIVAGLEGKPLPPPHRPTLRGLLLTGRQPRFLRADAAGDPGSAVAEHALWWPPSKIAGRYLAPALGTLDDERQLAAARQAGDSVDVTVELERRTGVAEPQLFDFPPYGKGL